MARCPSCKSSNLRSDFHPAPLIVRIFGFRSLICDQCDWQFIRFKPFPPAQGFDPYAISGTESPPLEPAAVHIKPAELPPAPAPPAEYRRMDRVTIGLPPALDPSGKDAERTPATADAQSQRLMLQAQNGDQRHDAAIELVSPAAGEKMPPCPQCGSLSVRRRLRKRLERVTVAMIDNEAFHCDHCQTPFYYSPEDEPAETAPAPSRDRLTRPF